MINQLLSSDNLQAVPRVRGTIVNESAGTDRVGRLIQVILAVYLIPVLMVVVVVSGVGMMILGISETMHGVSKWVKQMTQEDGKPDFYR